MKDKELVRRYITVGIIVFIGIGLGVANWMGKKQDSLYQLDSQQYNLMLSEIQNEHYSDALGLGVGLEKKHSNSDNIHYLTGIAATNTGDYEKGVQQFQRVLDINPYKVEEAIFMLQYAEILLYAEKSAEAAVVLERCSTLPAPVSYPDYHEKVTALQMQLVE